MKKDVFHFSKKFLNKDGFESDASIYTEIYFPSSQSAYAESTLKIRDCNHQIFLSIEISENSREDGEFDNSIFKIDTIIEELIKFREACIKAHEESIRRRAVLDEKEEEKAC